MNEEYVSRAYWIGYKRGQRSVSQALFSAQESLMAAEELVLEWVRERRHLHPEPDDPPGTFRSYAPPDSQFYTLRYGDGSFVDAQSEADGRRE
jgi:hypothetical protein